MEIWMNQKIEMLLELLYPRRCPICHKVVDRRGHLICEKCLVQVKPIGEPRCKKCGKPLASQEAEYCYDCQKGKHLYTRGLALLPYAGKIKQSVYQIKFHNKREYLDFYGPYMAEALKEQITGWRAQALIPVPLHPAKRRKRGFNQAELLAKELSKVLGIPMYTDVVIRCRNTKPQKELLLKERQNNLKKAFKIKKYDVELKRIILVDDIYTTGSTVDEITRELLECGVQEVYFLALCIGQGDC